MRALLLQRTRLWLLFLAVLALAGLQILLRASVQHWILPTRQAEWIWLPDAEEPTGPVAFYALRDFDLEQVPSRAELITVADEEALIFLNSVPVGEARYGSGESLKSFDVGDILQPGRNRLVAEVRSVRGAGGFLLRLSADVEGRSMEVVTNGSWRIFRQAEEALFEMDLPLPEGEPPHVWGPVPTGRWRLAARPSAMPTIAELRLTDKARGAERFRSWVTPRRWQELGKTDRSSPSLGHWVTFDFGKEATAYLALRFPARVDPNSQPIGLLYLSRRPNIENRSQADAYVVAMPDQRVWLAARPRRFRYATYVGLTPVSGADVYEVDGQRAGQIWPEEPPPAGPFGLPAAQLGPALEDVVWSELHGLTGFTVGE